MHSDKVTTSGRNGSRKSSKPIMEKRRRARINSSLAELKSMLMDVMKAEGACHNKMEKADILEMTVRHLRHLQRQQYTGSVLSDSSSKYKIGFTECTNEIGRLLESIETLDVEVKTRVIQHLANCVCKIVPPDDSRSHSSTSLSSDKASNVLEIQPSKDITSFKKSSMLDISTSLSTYSTLKPITSASSPTVNLTGNETATTFCTENSIPIQFTKQSMEIKNNSPDEMTTTTITNQPIIVQMQNNSPLKFESCASPVENTSSSSSVFSAATSFVSRNMSSDLQLFPAGVATGNFAFILPSVFTAGQLCGYVMPVCSQSTDLPPVSIVSQGKCNAGENMQGRCHSSGVPLIFAHKSPETYVSPIQNASSLGSTNVLVFPFSKDSIAQSIPINQEDYLHTTHTQPLVPSLSSFPQSFLHFPPFPSSYEHQQPPTQNMWRPW